jgi:hypothetical protein
MKNSDEHIIKISDIVYTAAILIAALVVFALAAGGGKGQTVVFKMDGEVLAELPLDKDATYEVRGAYANVFVIENSTLRVTETNCPNHECQKTGAVSVMGASIVCAPNHVSATITGEGAAIDAITG